MFNELKDICYRFHQNQISYCVLRLPMGDSFDEYEVDILVRDVELQKIHDVLIAQGFSYSNDHIISHHHYRCGKLHLDLVISLCYGKNREHYLSLGYNVLARAKFKDGIYFVDNNDEFILLLLRCLFDKKSFIKYNERILNLINKIGEEKCFKLMSNIYHLPK